MQKKQATKLPDYLFSLSENNSTTAMQFEKSDWREVGIALD